MSDTELVRSAVQVARTKDFTQKMLEDRYGIAPATFSRWVRSLEAGEEITLSRPNRAAARKLAGSTVTQPAMSWEQLLAAEVRANEERARAARIEAENAARRIELLRSCRQPTNGVGASRRGRDEEAEQVTVTPDDEANSP